MLIGFRIPIAVRIKNGLRIALQISALMNLAKFVNHLLRRFSRDLTFFAKRIEFVRHAEQQIILRRQQRGREEGFFLNEGGLSVFQLMRDNMRGSVFEIDVVN